MSDSTNESLRERIAELEAQLAAQAALLALVDLYFLASRYDIADCDYHFITNAANVITNHTRCDK